MKPPVFEYLAPRDLDEALEMTSRGGDRTVLLAGGQSLLPLLNHRRVRPATLVDLNGVPGLDSVEYGESSVRVGALARLRALERDQALGAALPVLREAVRLVAHPQVRTRSTFGGSLCHADPAAELPALAVAFGARLVLRSAAYGERTERAVDFFRPGGHTSRRLGEVLTTVELPRHPGFRFAFVEIPRTGRDGFPLVGVCVGLRFAESGAGGARTVAEARVAGAGVADRPLQLAAAERALTGLAATEIRDGGGRHIEAVLDAAAEDAAPPSDPYGSAEYRTALLRIALRRALHRLATDAQGSEDEGAGDGRGAERPGKDAHRTEGDGS